MSDPTPNPTVPTPPPAAPSPAAGFNFATAWQPGLVMAGAGLLGLLSTFLPWATVTTFIGTLSVSGIQGDGVIVLLLSIVLGALGVLLVMRPALRTKPWVFGAIAVAAIIVLVSLIDVANVSSAANKVKGVGSASVGIGLIIALLSGVAGVVGGIWALQGRLAAPANPSLPATPPAPPAPGATD